VFTYSKMRHADESVLVDDAHVVAGQTKTAQFRHRVEGSRVDEVYTVVVEIEHSQVIETFQCTFLNLLDPVTCQSVSYKQSWQPTARSLQIRWLDVIDKNVIFNTDFWQISSRDI